MQRTIQPEDTWIRSLLDIPASESPVLFAEQRKIYLGYAQSLPESRMLMDHLPGEVQQVLRFWIHGKTPRQTRTTRASIVFHTKNKNFFLLHRFSISHPMINMQDRYACIGDFLYEGEDFVAASYRIALQCLPNKLMMRLLKKTRLLSTFMHTAPDGTSFNHMVFTQELSPETLLVFQREIFEQSPKNAQTVPATISLQEFSNELYPQESRHPGRHFLFGTREILATFVTR